MGEKSAVDCQEEKPKGNTQFENVFEGGQNAPCCKEKVKVFSSENLRDQKIDRLRQSLHMMIVSLTNHNSFSCKFWIKRTFAFIGTKFCGLSTQRRKPG